jgi:hypothetical protein
MKNIKYFTLFLLGALLWQCELNVDEFEPSKGNADFTTFVSIGDSYSAGYTDGALGFDGQLVSFPNLIANQLVSVGMEGEFTQPLTAEGKSVGTTTIAPNTKNGYFKLQVVNGSLAPVPTVGDMTIFSTWIGDKGPFNNMGVPGAKSYHLLAPGFGNSAAGEGNFNPFFTRFSSNPATASVVGDAMLNNPTFFSLWIGGNDVLGYALAGGESDAITAPANFENYIGALVTTLSSGGAKGVIANVPNINAIPYFNYVQYNALDLTGKPESVTALNNAYAGYNALATSKGLPAMTFVQGKNAFVISDPDLSSMPESARFRQIKNGEKILLNIPQDSIKLKGWGSQKPIPAQYILDESELTAISNAVTAYNTSIQNIASTKGLAFVDLNGLMDDILDGKTIDGVNYSSAFISGNVFSLDGIHATPRGSAIIANEFIKAINSKFNANVPLVTVNDYRVNLFP